MNAQSLSMDLQDVLCRIIAQYTNNHLAKDHEFQSIMMVPGFEERYGTCGHVQRQLLDNAPEKPVPTLAALVCRFYFLYTMINSVNTTLKEKQKAHKHLTQEIEQLKIEADILGAAEIAISAARMAFEQQRLENSIATGQLPEKS